MINFSACSSNGSYLGSISENISNCDVAINASI